MAARKLMLIAAAAMLLAGCAGRYAPMHDQSVEMQAADRIYCKQVANGVTPQSDGGGFYAAGDPGFVKGAAIGYGAASLIVGIAQGIEYANNFDLCMTARGYQKVQAQ